MRFGPLRVLSLVLSASIAIVATALWSAHVEAAAVTLNTESGRSFRDTVPLGMFDDGAGGFEDPNWVLNASPSVSAWRTAIEFDVSALPANSTITSATVEFFFHSIRPHRPGPGRRAPLRERRGFLWG